MRSRLASGTFALAALGGLVWGLLPADAAQSRAVAGSVHQAYRANARPNAAAKVVRNTQDRSYRGAKLELAASYIGRDAAEPTIGVDQDGVAYYAAATFDTPGGALARTEVQRSDDDGRTWHSIQRELREGASIPPTTLDPYIYVDEDTGRLYTVDLYVGCSFLSYTDDGGETWTDNPRACGLPVNDHHTFVTGKPRPGDTTLGYPNVAYYCVNQVADVSCARSLDGGENFLPSGTFAYTGVDPAAGTFCGGLHGHLVVDNEGRLFLPKGHCGQPWVAVSEDGGLTWQRFKVSDIGAAGPHTSVTTDDAGNVYYVWWDNADHLPYLSVSRDHGRTWSKPVMIAPPGVYEANFPSIVASGKGRLVVTFPGTTVNDRQDGSRPWNFYVVQSMNALEARPLFVSATANRPSDPVHRGNCNGRCGGMFDFLDVILSPNGTIWAAAVDNCTGNCVKEGARATDAEGMAVVQVGGPGAPRRPRR